MHVSPFRRTNVMICERWTLKRWIRLRVRSPVRLLNELKVAQSTFPIEPLEPARSLDATEFITLSAAVYCYSQVKYFTRTRR